MFYDKFCSIFSCFVIKVIIEEPFCSCSSEPIRVFNQFNYLSSQSPLYKADEIKVLDSLMVAAVSDFRNNSCCSSLHIFSILSMSLLNVGIRIALHVRDVGGVGICIMEGLVYVLYLKLLAMNPSTLLAIL